MTRRLALLVLVPLVLLSTAGAALALSEGSAASTARTGAPPGGSQTVHETPGATSTVPGAVQPSDCWLLASYVEPWVSPAPGLDPSLRVSGEPVKTAQVALTAAGYDPGPPDGIYGSATDRAALALVAADQAAYPCIPPAISDAAVKLAALRDAAPELVAQRQAAIAAAAVVIAPRAVVTGAPLGSCSGAFDCFRTCTLGIESGGNYAAISAGGTYRGAWQFDQQTWDSNAATAGRADLVGADPATVNPSSQDQVAATLYSIRGNQPWGGRC